MTQATRTTAVPLIDGVLVRPLDLLQLGVRLLEEAEEARPGRMPLLGVLLPARGLVAAVRGRTRGRPDGRAAGERRVLAVCAAGTRAADGSSGAIAASGSPGARCAGRTSGSTS